MTTERVDEIKESLRSMILGMRLLLQKFEGFDVHQTEVSQPELRQDWQGQKRKRAEWRSQAAAQVNCSTFNLRQCRDNFRQWLVGE